MVIESDVIDWAWKIDRHGGFAIKNVEESVIERQRNVCQS